MNTITIDIENLKAQDELEGFWWNYIRNDFCFKNSISKEEYNQFPVQDFDILVHKQIKTGERFPTTRYHVVYIVDGKAESSLLEGKKIREIMSENFNRYVKKNGKIPFGCIFDKYSNDESEVQINYEPIEGISYKFKLDIDENHCDYESLPKEEMNPLKKVIIATNTISPIFYSSDISTIYETINENNSVISIKNGIISQIDTRISRYKEHETIWYLIEISEGLFEFNNTFNNFKYPLNIKISHNIMSNLSLQIGDSITFNGQLKLDKTLGYIVHNIKKMNKNN
ncbi:MAG: hypothetical protein WC934_02095 [Acidithiobacillus sp.]|jgi:hypothetical protein|uniref:hypothetical protein n=1 Tax=Acidithiobacillus sp. TaxID=1872118 RepID=UPI00355FD792